MGQLVVVKFVYDPLFRVTELVYCFNNFVVYKNNVRKLKEYLPITRVKEGESILFYLADPNTALASPASAEFVLTLALGGVAAGTTGSLYGFSIDSLVIKLRPSSR